MEEKKNNGPGGARALFASGGRAANSRCLSVPYGHELLPLRGPSNSPFGTGPAYALTAPPLRSLQSAMTHGKHALVLAMGCLGLSACANATESMMITADTALITTVGNNPGDRNRVIEDSLREAARLTRAQGYRYFVVMDAADASQTGHKIVAYGRVRQEKINDNPYGTSNLPSYTSVYGTYVPAGRSETYVKPGLDITIRMYKPGDIDPMAEGVLSADTVLSEAAHMPPRE
jgi:hypothetical protein